jgi:hypothetical protein
MWHIESHYPTQAKGRLEWGTQHLLPVERTAGPLASSGFPVGFGGFGEPHAAFLKESRIRGR